MLLSGSATLGSSHCAVGEKQEETFILAHVFKGFSPWSFDSVDSFGKAAHYDC